MTKKKKWVAWLLLSFGAFAIVMLVISTLTLSSWSKLAKVTQEDADAAFARIIDSGDGKPAYLQVSENGTVFVRRELEQSEPTELNALSLLAWRPKTRQLLRVEFPFWFVKIKMSRAINLGTLTSALAGDWENIDLEVSEEDLEKRGRGIILDRSLPDGARILLWTE